MEIFPTEKSGGFGDWCGAGADAAAQVSQGGRGPEKRKAFTHQVNFTEHEDSHAHVLTANYDTLLDRATGNSSLVPLFLFDLPSGAVFRPDQHRFLPATRHSN